MKQKKIPQTEQSQVYSQQQRVTNLQPNSLKQNIQSIKRPFLNRIQYSKLKIQSQIHKTENQQQEQDSLDSAIDSSSQKYEIFKTASQSSLQNQFQNQKSSSKKQLSPKVIRFNYEQQSDQQKQNKIQNQNYHIEWSGKNQDRMFSNRADMIEQYDRVFKKCYGFSKNRKHPSHSYQIDEKALLEKIFHQIKDQTDNSVSFGQVQQFLQECPVLMMVYDLQPSRLKYAISSSSYKYPNKLTKSEFFQLFLINNQFKKYQKLQKVQKICCLNETIWDKIKKIFDLLDTFGKGSVRTVQFFLKMKSPSVDKQLLESNAIFYTNVNRYYKLNKILFNLEHKKPQPQFLSWNDLQNQIINYTPIKYPSIDQIYENLIKSANIQSQANTFLLKDEILKILKEQFDKCPQFSENFVNCKYYCDELFLLDKINAKGKQIVRNQKGKGFITLLDTIKLLKTQGPEYFDLDEMLTYFSVKGFHNQHQTGIHKDQFQLKSTTSSQQFQQRKKKQCRLKRMKSLDSMQNLTKNIQKKNKNNSSNRKPAYKMNVQQFNLTQSRDYLTIRQKKVKEMIQQKQLKQKKQIKPYIIANSIPASNNTERYLDYKNKYDKKRQIQRQKLKKQHKKNEKKILKLKQNTKLFQKRNYAHEQEERKINLLLRSKKQFEAKPVSWFVQQRNLLQSIQNQKQQKRISRLRQTRQKYVFGYWKKNPYQNASNFKKLNLRNSFQKSQTINTLELIQLQLDKSTQPKRNIKTIPDFDKLHKEFIEELEAKKKLKSPTVIKEFNLSKAKTKNFLLQQKIVKSVLHCNSIRASSALKNQSPSILARTTKKFQAMLQMVQKRQNQKIIQSLMIKLQKRQKNLKKKAFTQFMKKAFQKQQQMHQFDLLELKKHKLNKCNQNFNHEEELKKIYQKALNRPFLFQTVNSKGLKIKNKNKNNHSKFSKSQKPEKVKFPNDQNQQIFDPEIAPLNEIQQEMSGKEDEHRRNSWIQDQESPQEKRDWQEGSNSSVQSSQETKKILQKIDLNRSF